MFGNVNKDEQNKVEQALGVVRKTVFSNVGNVKHQNFCCLVPDNKFLMKMPTVCQKANNYVNERNS